METSKRTITKKKILSKEKPPETAEKKKNKQTDQNQYLSESGATTTSSVSSNTKKKDLNGNYQTPTKNILYNFKIPSKKIDNNKKITSDYAKKINKIYSKGTIQNVSLNKNNTNLKNNPINNNKEYNRSLSLIAIDNNNNIKNKNSGNNKNNMNALYDKSQTNRKKKSIYVLKKNKNKNLGNKKIIPSPLNTAILSNITNDLFYNNIYSDSELNLVKTENKNFNPINYKINNLNLTVNKNLEESFFNKEPNISNRKIIKGQLSNSHLNILKNNNENSIIKNGYYSEAEKNNNNEKNSILNLEELLMTEEKLSAVINCIQDKKPCAEECFEWMNSYIQSDLINHIEKFFVKEQFIKIVKISINLNIFSLILCYVLSLNEIYFKKLNINLLEIMGINHRILILICKYFSNKIIDRNIWVEKLNQLIKGYDPLNKNTLQIIQEINNLDNFLVKLVQNILMLYSNSDLISIYNILENLSSKDLISIYREKFHKNINQNGSIFASSSYFLNNKINVIGSPHVPFLTKKSNKKYSLVLDLDETLIHFKPNPNNESSGKIMIRPYLYDFLKNIKKYYELIIFTAATQDYADPIINAIEKEEKYFEHRLYRMHTTIIDNDFVKDLSKLGRDLNRTIIVDNMKQNYKNQPNNGITIRPFWGKDVEDTALVDLLDILKKIVEKNMDVISGLKYYKEDIISKVSSNILRRAQIK